MKKILLMPLLLILLFSFCGNRNSADENTVSRMSLADTLDLLKERALVMNSLEFLNDSLPMTYLKTGFFLDSLHRTALLIQNPMDTSYIVQLFVEKDNKWIRSDSISGLWGLSANFDVKYQDYNFDGISDIYIQSVVSNGFVVSRGHLLIVDPVLKKLIYQDEANGLGNLMLDAKNKVIYSQEAIIDNYGEWKYQMATNEWINGKLVTVRKDNPADPDTRE